jgi:hypothetical protein
VATPVCRGAMIGHSQIRRPSKQAGNTMKTMTKYIAPWLAAAAIAGAVGLAPVASANTDPLVPSDADPHVPYVLGAPLLYQWAMHR